MYIFIYMLFVGGMGGMPGGLEGMMKNPQMMAMAQQMMKDPKVRIHLCIYICICI
jgi:hypothetical protein